MALRSRLAALALTVALAAPAAAQDYASGQEAYAARDWQAAEAIWRDEAEADMPEALIGLGNLLDFGLVGPADPEGAFALYTRAAELGDVEAAFNVAVMLDSGVGAETDRAAAAGWYSLAALGEFARAQYNLGQMYARGEGVPANGRLARLWLGRAEPVVPAAAEVLGDVELPAVTTLGAPTPLQFVTVEGEARVAWASPAGPEGARYRVEIVDAAPDAGARVVAELETAVSAAAIPVPEMPESAAWRVLQLTDTDYAASEWTLPGGEPASVPAASLVRFEVPSGDRRALGYAERIGASFERSGAAVRYSEADAVPGGSGVVYAYDADGALALGVSAFLPSLDAAEPQRDGSAGLAPGEVLVRIVFGPPDP